MITRHDNLSQPYDLTKESDFARQNAVRWISTPVGLSSHKATRNIICPSQLAISQDGNNEFIPTVTRHGVGGINSATSDASALKYLTESSVIFSGATELTIGVAFVFDSADTSAQWLNFRLSLYMTLDVFSQTGSSINWGADWFGAWNGASQQTLSGLSDGDLVTLCAVIRQNGARFFHQGLFSGTKSGGTGSVSSGQVSICNGTRAKFLLSYCATSAASDEWAQAFTSNPWLIFDSGDADNDTARLFYYLETVGGGGDVLNRGMSSIGSGVVASQGGGYSGLHGIEDGFIS